MKTTPPRPGRNLGTASRAPRGALTITVHASVTITLTASQIRLLRFLADQCDPPRTVRLTNYAGLHAQGLIYLRSDPAKYYLTELGQQTVQALGPADLENH